MKTVLILLILIVTIGHKSLIAQEFQSPNNPLYWKNKTENKSYWQQDIDYKIDAYLDEKNELIKGNEIIEYTNNSPNSLHELYINLYQNAFIKNSYHTQLQRANDVEPKFGKWEAENKGNEILSLKINKEHLPYEIDGTILRVKLKKPLAPSEKLTLDISFITYYSKGGNTRRRMKSYLYKGKMHFNGAHWYPRLAVYDRKFGWCTDQHLNREFYGDFGHYAVSLNMPANFLVEATGEIQNEKDVLPDSIKSKLQLSNYWTHTWDTAISYNIPMAPNERRVWKFDAINVHDFAWIAGPHYRKMEINDKGLKIVAMVLEPHASGWKNACQYTHQVMSIYSRDFGPYYYPKMVIADCQDGMEYPMLTMDNGSDPGYRKLLAHEVGHNWFYGMVNNNETYRAMLDEGFTQFLTVWALERIDGKYVYQSPEINRKMAEGKMEGQTVRDAYLYNGYFNDAIKGEDPTLNTHSDGFNGALGQGGGYGHVYSKTGTMLFNLQYVLGDSLFLEAMKYYVKTWSFRHPYIEDFRQSMIDYTKVDLNWFFDQWIETSKTIDYKINSITKIDSNQYKLSLSRKGKMQMPLDITLWGESGHGYNFYIPNTWFEKKTNATILPRWIGWDNKLMTDYVSIVSVPENIKKAQIDPSNRLADINELNNSTKFPLQLKNAPSDLLNRRVYQASWTPDIGYNNFDGIKVGVTTQGSYFRNYHQLLASFWVNTRLGKGYIRDINENIGSSVHHFINDWVSFKVKYATALSHFIPKSLIAIEARHLDGMMVGSIEFTKNINENWSFSVADKFLKKNTFSQLNYEFQPNNSLGFDGINNCLILKVKHQKMYRGQWFHQANASARASFLSYTSYSYIDLEDKISKNIGKLRWNQRLYLRYGFNDNLTPLYTNLNLGGANNEEFIENSVMRSVSFFPNAMTPLGDNNTHLHYSGGLNLRGYAMTQYIINNGTSYSIQNQNTGIAFNGQLQLENLTPRWLRPIKNAIGLEYYLFGDIGQIAFNTSPIYYFHTNSPVLYDAGVGVGLDLIKKNIPNTNFRATQLRFDIPLYLSHPLASDNGHNLTFRWLIGIQKAL